MQVCSFKNPKRNCSICSLGHVQFLVCTYKSQALSGYLQSSLTKNSFMKKTLMWLFDFDDNDIGFCYDENKIFPVDSRLCCNYLVFIVQLRDNVVVYLCSNVFLSVWVAFHILLRLSCCCILLLAWNTRHILKWS